MKHLPNALSGRAYLQGIVGMSLSHMDEDTLVPESFLLKYCGWTREDVNSIIPHEEKAHRFGPLGPKSVKGYHLGTVLKTERKRDFRTRHTAPLMMSETRLKSEYYFTDGLIAKWLPKPDILVDNPHYKSAAPMKLHRIGKVLMIRQIEEAEADLAKVADQRLTRSAAARAAAEKRREAWISAFDEIEIDYDFDRFDTFEKVDAAARNREGMSEKRWQEVDIGTRHRWTVNMLRHEFTDYDRILALELPPGMAGEQCYRGLKVEILCEIGRRYPELKAESDRQAWG